MNQFPAISLPDAPIPIYFKLQTMLKQEIETGRWRLGCAIPPERMLAKMHQVSVGTVKRALLNLVNEGYLNRVQGKGTFVLGSALRPGSLRYYRLRRHFHDTEADLQVRLIGITDASCSRAVARYLQLQRGERVYRVTRLFSHGEQPAVYTVSHFPKKLFPRLHQWPRSRFETMPLYLSLEEHYRLPVVLNHELFGARRAMGQVARALGARTGREVLYIEMISFTYGQTPYEYRETYSLTDSYRVFRETPRRARRSGGASASDRAG